MAPPTQHNDPRNKKLTTKAAPTRIAHASQYRLKAEQQRAARRRKANGKLGEEIFFEEAINIAEDKQTTKAKAENKIKPPTRQRVSLLQQGKSVV